MTITKTTKPSADARGTVLESRTIDYIPSKERHGKPWHLATLWFIGNSNLLSFASGAIGISIGLNVTWSLIAVIVGLILGTVLMSYHSAQGPSLGLPQMIQSRPQFGYFGSLIPLVAALAVFIGWNVFDVLLVGQIADNEASVPLDTGEIIGVVLSTICTIIGYKFIHRVSRWVTGLFIVVYGLLAIAAITAIHLPSSMYSLSHGFHTTPFLLVVGVMASFQLTWAPYVSDYSRYLPRETPVRSTVGWTYIGSFLGVFWPAALGVFVTAAFPKLLTLPAVNAVGDSMFTGFGAIVLWCSIPPLITAVAIGIYSGGLTLLAGVDLVKDLRSNAVFRTLSMVVVAAAVLLLALLVPTDFLADFTAFLTTMLYFMIPWTAINLTDFFLVRHGLYATLDIFQRDGIYGWWNWRGLLSYFVTIAVMIPFFSVKFYTGPVAHALDGADISPFVGFPFGALLYWALYRGYDLRRERELAREQIQRLEQDPAAEPAAV